MTKLRVNLVNFKLFFVFFMSKGIDLFIFIFILIIEGILCNTYFRKSFSGFGHTNI